MPEQIEVECSISNADFIEVRPEFPYYANVLDAARHVQRFLEFVQHEATELVTLVLFWLIARGTHTSHLAS